MATDENNSEQNEGKSRIDTASLLEAEERTAKLLRMIDSLEEEAKNKVADSIIEVQEVIPATDEIISGQTRERSRITTVDTACLLEAEERTAKLLRMIDSFEDEAKNNVDGQIRGQQQETIVADQELLRKGELKGLTSFDNTSGLMDAEERTEKLMRMISSLEERATGMIDLVVDGPEARAALEEKRLDTFEQTSEATQPKEITAEKNTKTVIEKDELTLGKADSHAFDLVDKQVTTMTELLQAYVDNPNDVGVEEELIKTRLSLLKQRRQLLVEEMQQLLQQQNQATQQKPEFRQPPHQSLEDKKELTQSLGLTRNVSE